MSGLRRLTRSDHQPLDQLEQRGRRFRRAFDDADESRVRAEDRCEKERQERIDHLARDVGEEADGGERVDIPSQSARRMVRVGVGVWDRIHESSNLPLAAHRRSGHLLAMTIRAPSPPDTNAVHRRLAPARARLAARDDAIVRSQITIAQIAAPTGEEHERGSWVSRRFRDCGLTDIHTDDAGNVIGRRAGTEDAPPVVICAHLDTCFRARPISPSSATANDSSDPASTTTAAASR
jgi:hypothetical protein